MKFSMPFRFIVQYCYNCRIHKFVAEGQFIWLRPKNLQLIERLEGGRLTGRLRRAAGTPWDPRSKPRRTGVGERSTASRVRGGAPALRC
jgi:hypothetical protein